MISSKLRLKFFDPSNEKPIKRMRVFLKSIKWKRMLQKSINCNV